MLHEFRTTHSDQPFPRPASAGKPFTSRYGGRRGRVTPKLCFMSMSPRVFEFFVAGEVCQRQQWE